MKHTLISLFIAGGVALLFTGFSDKPIDTYPPAFSTYQDIIQWMAQPTDDHIMVVAHRGDWRNAPENSIPAVLNCIEMGVEIVEIDIRMTKDSHLVVIHDKTLDRTTTGKGKVADWTLDSIKTLNLKNGAAGTTSHRVPTLEEMMLAVKGKPALLNLDKAWSYLPQTIDVLRRTGTLRQCIFKGNEPYGIMRNTLGNLLDSIIYMPMVWPADYNIYKKKEDLIKDPLAYAQQYIEQLNPLAFEVIYSDEESNVFDAIDHMAEHDIAVWVNALWGKLCAYHHDDMALADPDAHYGWIIEHGANIIQTDRPEFLINYLSEKGLRSFPKPNRMERLIADLEDAHNDRVMVVAHRGDWRNAPENSLQAIENCIEMGVDMVEIDVRMTKDSVLVLMHDETIDRTTNGTGYIWDIAYRELSELYLRNGLLQTTPHRVPTLEQALLTAKDRILINLDTKDYKSLQKYYHLLQQTGTLDQVVIKAPIRKNEAVAIFGDLLDEIYFMPLVRTARPGAVQIVEEYLEGKPPVAFEFTVPSDTVLLLSRFGEIRKKGAQVWVNSLRPEHCAKHDDELAAITPSVYDWFIDHQINMIQTDRPQLLISYLRKRGLHD